MTEKQKEKKITHSPAFQRQRPFAQNPSVTYSYARVHAHVSPPPVLRLILSPDSTVRISHDRCFQTAWWKGHR